MNSEEKKVQIMREINNEKLDIVMLTETHMYNVEEKGQKYTFYTSGVEEDLPRKSGVRFLVKNELTRRSSTR